MQHKQSSLPCGFRNVTDKSTLAFFYKNGLDWCGFKTTEGKKL